MKQEHSSGPTRAIRLAVSASSSLVARWASRLTSPGFPGGEVHEDRDCDDAHDWPQAGGLQHEGVEESSGDDSEQAHQAELA